MSAELLRIENISKAFGGRQVLRDVSLTLHEGELICLLGKSGAGKSTLFHIIAGLLSPDAGQILLRGKNITDQTGHVSYMLQKDLLLPFRTVEDNVILPLLLSGMRKDAARKRAAALFSTFGLAGCEKKWPSQLSGGMRQRAALLRTYLFSGEAALLDEPFSALDELTKAAMHRWYMDVMEQIRLSTLFITHNVDEALFLADRILLMGGAPAGILGEISIREPRPRTSDFILSQTYLDYKRAVMAYLGA